MAWPHKLSWYMFCFAGLRAFDGNLTSSLVTALCCDKRKANVRLRATLPRFESPEHKFLGTVDTRFCDERLPTLSHVCVGLCVLMIFWICAFGYYVWVVHFMGDVMVLVCEKELQIDCIMQETILSSTSETETLKFAQLGKASSTLFLHCVTLFSAKGFEFIRNFSQNSLENFFWNEFQTLIFFMCFQPSESTSFKWWTAKPSCQVGKPL